VSDLSEDIAAVWADGAQDLATWTMANLVNRTDRCGEYDDEGPKNFPKNGPRAGYLDHARLVRHFRASDRYSVVGVHALGPDSSGRWGGWDFDCHDGTAADPVANEKYAVRIHDRLTELGIDPLLTSSDGVGGYHCRAVFETPIPGPVLYRFARWAVADFSAHGLIAVPEAYPKQKSLTETARWGNWLRLPGRHYKRPHWSRVWDGRRWLDGTAAVKHILSIKSADRNYPGRGVRRARRRLHRPAKNRRRPSPVRCPGV
jgi:hypothetical protein